MKLYREILLATLLELGSIFLIILGWIMMLSAPAFVKDEPMWQVMFNGGLLLFVGGVGGSVFVPSLFYSHIKAVKKRGTKSPNTAETDR